MHSHKLHTSVWTALRWWNSISTAFLHLSWVKTHYEGSTFPHIQHCLLVLPAFIYSFCPLLNLSSVRPNHIVIHRVVLGSFSFLTSIPLGEYIIFIYSAVEEHLCISQMGMFITNSAPMNILLHAFFWTYKFISPFCTEEVLYIYVFVEPGQHELSPFNILFLAWSERD